MMVELLAKRTAMQVIEASQRAFIEPDRLYVIPPGRFLSVEPGMLHLSESATHHGVRLPFDFLLESLARCHGPRSACIMASGRGSDDSQSLPAFKAAGGLNLAQLPQQAEYSGMPESGIKLVSSMQYRRWRKCPRS
jgi:two-component system CheB/CheR fusion protein